jgi:hypothetical protein
MIKVKKEWRKLEQEIIQACKYAQSKGIRIVSGDFGIRIINLMEGNYMYVQDYENMVCPLGATLLFKPFKLYYTPKAEIIGANEIWFNGFHNGVDGCARVNQHNNWRAGYQAGRRVAKQFGLHNKVK